jgi:hypothetical protein
MRALRVPALTSWRYEVRCSDDGVGVDAATVDRRLGVLGELPEQRGNRGLFGRGLRDVWLAQGAGRIEGVRGERAVESWFFPAAGDDRGRLSNRAKAATCVSGTSRSTQARACVSWEAMSRGRTPSCSYQANAATRR